MESFKNHFSSRKKFFRGKKRVLEEEKKFSGTKSHAGSKKNPSGGNPMSFSEGNFSYLTEEDFLFRTLDDIVG